MIDSFLYLPDYPIGHMIAFQIERQMEKAGSIGPEFERMAKIGNVAPGPLDEEAPPARRSARRRCSRRPPRRCRSSSRRRTERVAAHRLK